MQVSSQLSTHWAFKVHEALIRRQNPRALQKLVGEFEGDNKNLKSLAELERLKTLAIALN